MDLRFFLDEDMPRSSGDIIKNHNYEVTDVRDTELRGATDEEIIERAREKNEIVVTRDTDFGDVLRYPDHPGALILRLPHNFTASKINERLDKFLSETDPEKLKNTITILELERYRTKKI